MTDAAPNVLLVYPKFSNTSFWNYLETCELVGAKYPAPPLGLITVAAMLPGDWPVRLVDCNVEALTDEAIAWADIVMFSGMITQQLHLFQTHKRVQAMGKTTMIGGPDVSSNPDIYKEFDIRVIGEAEGIIDEVVAAIRAGTREGIFTAPLHSVDVTKTPIPRFELLEFSNYMNINVQLSRGCPFLCEFCDIIELFGRKPRSKTDDQILAELDRLHALGYRGYVDFVDDNLIGNKKTVKAFLPKLVQWQKDHGYPFEFSTEASLNLADDDVFMGMMRDAGFFAVFVGIESPDPEVLVKMQKKQNTKRDIARCIHKIQGFGIFVVAGFIIGFDNESEHVAEGMIELIEEASIPVSMVGLLTALPNTQLQRRLEAEGRLPTNYAVINPEKQGDQCVAGLNFETQRPRHDVQRDYLKVVETIYDPEVFFARVRKMVDQIDASGPSGMLRKSMLKRDALRLIRLFWRASLRRPDLRLRYWKLLAYVLRTNPRAIKHALYNAGLFAHLGPFSGYIKAEVTRQIEEGWDAEGNNIHGRAANAIAKADTVAAQ